MKKKTHKDKVRLLSITPFCIFGVTAGILMCLDKLSIEWLLLFIFLVFPFTLGVIVYAEHIDEVEDIDEDKDFDW